MFSFEESEITFQILPKAGINVSQVVKKIKTVKDKFAKITGYSIDNVNFEEQVNFHGNIH